MKSFFTLAELADFKLPDLPTSLSSLKRFADAHAWRTNADLCRKVDGKTKAQWEYHLQLLPTAAQARLAIIQSGTTDTDWEAARARKDELWVKFNNLTKSLKDACEARLKVLLRVEELVEFGLARTAAVALAAHEAGVVARSVFNWRELTRGLDRADWLAALSPSFSSSKTVAECHADAWEYLKSDYLRPGKSAFSACYRRMEKVAKREGWQPIPSERCLRRRFEAEVSKAVVTLKRSGKDKARTLYPAQRRSRAHLHAMQMANMDGHKIDVFVSVPWSKKPVRFYVIGIQDLYSGKIVAHRLAEAETWEAVRLVIGDMVEAFGIPEKIYIDNGKAFASKWITGDTVQRFRFKVKEEDPRGLLNTLGVEVHWTRPYAGQSKPIERAWRDLAENISKHPFCDGAYTGNKPDAKPENYASRAIPYDDFKAHVAAQIVEHNAQLGRRAENCKGRSFDETFAASMAAPSTIVRVPSPAQASLWLLASEAIKTRTGSGEIHYQGNRYWARELNQWAGKKVVIRFDPDALHETVKVYDLKNRIICEARCVEDAGFDNIDDARMHARALKTHQKAVKAVADAHATLSARQLGEIYYKGTKPAPAAKQEAIRPTITRLITSNQIADEPVAAISDQDFESRFSRALGMVQSGAVLEFPSGNTPVSSASGGQHEPKSNAYGSGKKKGGRKTAQ